MKTNVIFFVVSLCLSVLSQAQEAQQGKYFFTKSGHIEYTLGGSSRGTKTVWFDDYGMLMKTLTESTTTVTLAGFTNTTTEKKLEIRKGKEIWMADLLSNTGSRTGIEMQTDFGKSLTSGKSDAELQKIEQKMITDLGGEILGYETFIGKKCLVFTLGTSQFYQYKGIPLKSEVTMMGVEITETAVLFKESIPVPASTFDLPAGIDFQKAESISGMLQQMQETGGFNEEEGTGVAPGMSFAKFGEATQNLNIPGYEYFMTTDNQDVYLTSYAKTETDQVIIFAENEARFESFLSQGDSYVVKSQYRLKGKEAAFLHILKDEEGTPVDSRMLMIRLPEYKTVLYILSSMPFSQKEMEGFMEQVKL
jgi:hypothetical protein